MKSTERMREWLVDEANENEWKSTWFTVTSQVCKLDEMLDEIEAEIEADYIKLPVDADGVPLEIGDELKCQDKSVLLNSLIWDGKTWHASETIVSSGWYPSRLCEHVKPRTLEDVLNDYKHGDMTQEGAIAEIRELMGGDAR